MKAKTVTTKELFENNPTLCLQVLRVFNECHKCIVLQQKIRLYEPKGYSVESIIRDKMRCTPKVNAKFFELRKQKRQLLEQLHKLETEMKKL